jgi:hypothetical protein
VVLVGGSVEPLLSQPVSDLGGSGTVTNMTDTAIPGAPTNRYYRVRVLLP